MRLDLRTAKDYPDKHLDFSYLLHGLSCRGIEQEPVSVTGYVKNMSGALVLEGRLEGVLSLVCDRCGTSFKREKTLTVSGILSEAPGTDDDGIYVYSGGSVELDDIFISEFILDTDMRILCRDDCTGGDLGKYFSSEKDE